MRKPHLLSGLALLLALACSGKTLDVGNDPGDGDGDSVSGDGDGDGATGDGDGDSGGTTGDGDGDSGGTTGDGDGDGSVVLGTLPCDILGSAGQTCVAAHSTVRLLNSEYEGPLYEVCQGSALAAEGCDGQTMNISARGMYPNLEGLAEFCASESCKISKVYDQSGMGNHLEPSPPGQAKPTPGNPVSATALPVNINGQSAYGMLFRPMMGYRAGCTGCSTPSGNGVPVGDEPETIYMVTGSQDLIDGCCFDYGNGSLSMENGGNGTTEAVYFGLGVIWGTGVGSGPWVMADLENGLYPGWENGSFGGISTNTSLEHDFVTAIVVGDTADKNGGKGRFALYGGDAQEGNLIELYDGIRPESPGYVPMMKEGSVILSIASDNSDGDGGRFYEGVIALGAASVPTLESLQASIAAAGYETAPN